MSVAFESFDEEKERARLCKMTDADLVREGRAARYMCSPNANFGKPPQEIYVSALRLCKEEWRRRHPKQGKTYEHHKCASD